MEELKRERERFTKWRTEGDNMAVEMLQSLTHSHTSAISREVVKRKVN